MLLNAADPPTTPPKVVLPVLLSCSATAPLTVPPKVMSAVPEFKVTASTKVMGVLLSPKLMTVLAVFKVPPMLMLLGAVATKPPVKVKLSPAALPSFKVPVFKNSVAPVTLVVAPKSDTLYPLAVVVSAAVLRLSANSMVRPACVLDNQTCVSALTGLLKVAP